MTNATMAPKNKGSGTSCHMDLINSSSATGLDIGLEHHYFDDISGARDDATIAKNGLLNVG